MTLQQLHAVRDELLGKYVTLGLQALEAKQRLKGLRKRERAVLEDLVQVDQQIRRMAGGKPSETAVPEGPT